LSIEDHVQRAKAERLVAARSEELGTADIHIALAEMHEQAAARGLNQSLAPFEHSMAWRRFAQ
jgi:hypothetical protein